MRTRLVFGAASVASMVAMLWGSVTPVRACSCGPLEAEEALENSDFVVAGELTAFRVVKEPRFVPAEDLWSGKVNPFEPYFDGEGIVRVDRYLKGDGPTSLRFGDDTGCGLDLSQLITSRHVIFLAEYEDNVVASTCIGTIPLHLADEMAAREALSELELVTGQGTPPSWEGDNLGKQGDFPWAAAAIAAVLGPPVLLARAAFVWRRSG